MWRHDSEPPTALTEKTVVRAGFGVSYVPFVDNTYAYNYPIKTSTFYTNHADLWSGAESSGWRSQFCYRHPCDSDGGFRLERHVNRECSQRDNRTSPTSTSH